MVEESISSENFSFKLDIALDIYMPHEIKFSSKKVNINETYIYSSLYLLTNIEFYMNYFLHLNKNALDNKLGKMFFEMINIIYRAMDKKKDDEVVKSVNEFIAELRESEDWKNKEIAQVKDCRNFISHLFWKIIKINSNNKSLYESIKIDGKTDSINASHPKNILSSLEESILSSCFITEDSEYNNNDIVIKMTNRDNRIKYFHSLFIRFDLSDEKKIYNLEECLENYLKKTQDNLSINFSNNSSNSFYYEKKLYYKLPETIIILVSFGDDEKNIFKCRYNFDEILDLNNLIKEEKVDNEYKDKKYYLSGLIACKFPKNKNRKFFYTYCRRDQNSKCIQYNCKEDYILEEIDDNKEIKNKLNKEEIIDEKSANSDTTSYPYALVYTEIKNPE